MHPKLMSIGLEMNAAVLPASRSIQLGVPASAFATILNAGNTIAIVCKLAPLPPFENVPFSFAATDPITNQVVGETSTPVVIPAGVAQSFVFDFRPDVAIFPPADVQLSLGCAGTSAPVVIGLNTLLLSASPTPVPDIIALAATATPGLTLVIPTSTNAGAFAVATSNVGASGTITVTADGHRGVPDKFGGHLSRGTGQQRDDDDWRRADADVQHLCHGNRNRDLRPGP